MKIYNHFCHKLGLTFETDFSNYPVSSLKAANSRLDLVSLLFHNHFFESKCEGEKTLELSRNRHFVDFALYICRFLFKSHAGTFMRSGNLIFLFTKPQIGLYQEFTQQNC